MSYPSDNHHSSTSQKQFFGRTAARFYAVQALYAWDIHGAFPKNCAPPFLNEENLNPLEEAVICFNANDSLFETLCHQASTYQKDIDACIEAVLTSTWRLERLHYVVRALLRVAVAEILYHHDTPAPVIINEYLNIAKTFFDEKDVRFINGSLDKAVKNSRSQPSSS
jgi:N utilization substance protein B